MQVARETAANLQGVLEDFQASRDADIYVALDNVQRELEKERSRREESERAMAAAKELVRTFKGNLESVSAMF